MRRLRAGNGDIAIVWDRLFGMARFPAGLRRLFVAELVYGAGPAGRVAPVRHAPSAAEDCLDGVAQRGVTEGDAGLVLKSAGTEFSPGVDMDRVGPATATEEAVVSRGRQRSGGSALILFAQFGRLM